MSSPIILASGSEIRRRLLENVGVPIRVDPVRVDEQSIRAAMLADNAAPRDIADALADAKARRGSSRYPDALVLGCDQVLDAAGTILGKPTDAEEARAQLALLNGREHRLISAAVIYSGGSPRWRHVGSVTLQMRKASDAWLDDYVMRNWHSIRHSVGGYKLEEEGARLFRRIDGDYFTVLGLPLLEILGYLSETEVLSG